VQPVPPVQPAPGSTIGISVGVPTVNGQPAADGPGPNIPTGSTITVTVPVTNTGNVPVTLTATLPDGQQLSCAPNPVNPGQTANCTITMPAQSGPNTVIVNIIATGPNGEQQSTSCQVYYTGTPCDCGPRDTK
jgi:hypothetical protein